MVLRDFKNAIGEISSNLTGRVVWSSFTLYSTGKRENEHFLCAYHVPGIVPEASHNVLSFTYGTDKEFRLRQVNNGLKSHI